MAALFTLLLGASSLLLGYFLYDFSRQNFIRETEAAIDNEIEHILAIAEEHNTEKLTEHIRKRSERSASPIYLFRAKDGRKIAGNIDVVPEQVERIKEGVLKFSVRRDNTQRMVAAKIHTFPDGSTLVIARDIHEIIRSYEHLKLFSAVIMLFMLIVVLVSFFISIFVVGRINLIATTARQIMDTGDLSRRICIDTNWDDLSDLAQTLNALLERIETLMQGIRDVTDSIAHDLRTPLTRLRNQLEDAINSPLDAKGGERLLAEADNLLTTFNALLRIANIEKGKREQAFATIDLGVVLRDVIELYEALAEERHITVNFFYHNSPPFLGDRNLLFQLFANLLDNAIKFSPADSVISVTLEVVGNNSVVTIADQGIGIAASEKEKVFDRFYRSDKSRHTAGCGLGLSLVKAALELHKGTIMLHDNHPGLRVEVFFQH